MGRNYDSCDAYKREGVSAVTNWYDEIKNYDYATQKKIDPAGCAIGHFTQAVWADMRKLGFGIAVSPKGRLIGKNNCFNLVIFLVLCRYFPAGNIVND